MQSYQNIRLIQSPYQGNKGNVERIVFLHSRAYFLDRVSVALVVWDESNTQLIPGTWHKRKHHILRILHSLFVKEKSNQLSMSNSLWEAVLCCPLQSKTFRHYPSSPPFPCYNQYIFPRTNSRTHLTYMIIIQLGIQCHWIPCSSFMG